MLRLLTKVLLLVTLLGTTFRGNAFSLMGPYAIEAGGEVWQVLRIGYNEPFDIGGVMNAAAGEEYRWNTPNVYYAYDAPFLNFFGTRGLEELEKAIKILNDLPPASQLNVDDYPMMAERANFRAAALGLLDLKSSALQTILEEMGLASPSRYVYTLRNRYQPGPNRYPVFFTVIRRNFDPITAAESPYINGRLWTYVDIVDPDQLPPGSFTINTTVDPLDFGRFDPVAGPFYSGFGIGSFYNGLTRDDVGAIKFIYQAANLNSEALIPGSTNAGGFTPVTGGGGSPWSIPSTNVTGVPGAPTGSLVDPVLRKGVDKVTFVRGEFDSLLGQFFTPITSVYVDTFITNGVERSQTVLRQVTVPDILFSAADLNDGAEPGGIPADAIGRTVTAGWQNSDNIGFSPFRRAGPGVILPPIQILFNNVGFINVDVATGVSGNAVFGFNVFPFLLWGAFDGSTNDPVVFSQGGNITLQQLEQLRLGR
jgi:hypothetical protein